MSNKLFNNFPTLHYTLNTGEIVRIKDFFRKAKVETAALDSVIEYQYYEILDGERPDVVASKLYGDGNLHWTFFLVNDFDNYYDWFMDYDTFNNYINEKYPGQCLIFDDASTIISPQSFANSEKSNVNPLGWEGDNKILIGETLTLLPDTKKVSVLQVDPTHNCIVVTGDIIESGDSLFSNVSAKTISPTSVMNHRDGVHHYVDSVGTHRTYGGSGWSSVSHLKKEEEENEKKRQIKIIRPERMKRVLREFERIMSDE
jgi:hypothetical protein